MSKFDNIIISGLDRMATSAGMKRQVNKRGMNFGHFGNKRDTSTQSSPHKSPASHFFFRIPDNNWKSISFPSSHAAHYRGLSASVLIWVLSGKFQGSSACVSMAHDSDVMVYLPVHVYIQ